MLVAQLTDLHIDLSSDRSRSLVDERANLELAIDTVLAHDPDAVILTGDLVNNCAAAEYDVLAEILQRITVPYYPIAGNHDDQRLLRNALASSIPDNAAESHLSYVVDDHEVRLVALDTSDTVLDEGVFSDDRAAWLDATLRARPDQPTLLFTHYPPFVTGIDFMDLAGVRERDRFESILDAHPQVGLVACGHTHRDIQTVIGSARISVCPSTVHQLALDFDPAAGAVVGEPAGYQLHTWTGRRFVTHTGVIGDYPRVDLSEYVAYVHATAAAGKPFLKSDAQH